MTYSSIDSRLQLKSSLEVVEEFYGEQLSSRLADTVEETPRYQLNELMDRLTAKSISRSKAWRDRGIDKDSTVSPAAICNLEPSELGFSFHEDMFFSGGLSTPMQTYYNPPANSASAGRHPALKHLLLFSEHVMIHDAIAEWAECSNLSKQGVDKTDRRFLASSLREILPIAELVRGRSIIPLDRVNTEVASSSATLIDGEKADEPGTPLGYLLGPTTGGVFFRPSILYEDPYLAWILIYRSGIVEEWALPSYRISTIDDLMQSARSVVDSLGEDGVRIDQTVARVLEIAYPDRRNHADIYRAQGSAILSSHFGVNPVAASTSSRQQLIRSSSVFIDGAEKSSRVKNIDLQPFVQYQVPDTSSVTIDDLIRLRASEDAFVAVRESLGQLAALVNAEGDMSSYSAFSRSVEEIADNVARPAYERLNRKAKRGTFNALLGGFAASGVVSVTINGIAVLIGGPLGFGVRSAAGPASNATRSIVSNRVRQSSRPHSVGSSILLSVIQGDR